MPLFLKSSSLTCPAEAHAFSISQPTPGSLTSIGILFHNSVHDKSTSNGSEERVGPILGHSPGAFGDQIIVSYDVKPVNAFATYLSFRNTKDMAKAHSGKLQLGTTFETCACSQLIAISVGQYVGERETKGKIGDGHAPVNTIQN